MESLSQGLTKIYAIIAQPVTNRMFLVHSAFVLLGAGGGVENGFSVSVANHLFPLCNAILIACALRVSMTSEYLSSMSKYGFQMHATMNVAGRSELTNRRHSKANINNLYQYRVYMRQFYFNMPEVHFVNTFAASLFSFISDLKTQLLLLI